MTISGATSADASSRPVGRGGWVYLPDDFARQHPLYGVYGWALLLLALLFFGPIVFVAQDFRILFGVGPRPDLFWTVLIAELIFLAACWAACRSLGAESRDFPKLFYLAALIGLVTAFAFFAVLIEGLPRDYEERALLGFVWRAVPILIWAAYVALSKRINVTTLKRVNSRDPFLRSQWLSDETPAGEVSQTRRRSLFARPVRKVPVVTTRPPGEAPPAAAERLPAREAVPEFAPRRETSPPEPAADAPGSEPAGRQPASGRVLRQPPAAPPAGRYYTNRRVLAAMPGEPIMTRRPEGGTRPLPEAERRHRIEAALVLDRLRRLQIAHDEGLITDEELRAKRTELLREF